MGDPVKQAPKKPLSRCGERVDYARLAPDWIGSFSVTTEVHSAGAPDKQGREVAAMYLHPAGLVIVPKTGAHAGRKMLVPASKVEFSLVSDDET